MFRSVRFSVALVVVVTSACSDSARGPSDPAVNASPVLGRLAFEQSCSGCHASNDAFDVKTFGFMDTTIIRRAVKHVDTATARNIVAYIRTIAAPRIEQNVRLFQPKGNVLTSDVDFAIALFGRDAWPDNLTSAGLASIDPRTVQIGVRLPIWSDEKTNLDWMPDFALPSSILDYNGGMAAAAIAGYRAAP
ncbi:MAG TPA: hypothetical protein VM099_01975, partial [Gemmatimonadaceae bacterium]|nr:hypothetical protein [Gemmatimonadaceae bacterium]